MKCFVTLLALLWLVLDGHASAQDDEASLRASRAKKLAAAFLEENHWHLKLGDARSAAERSGTMIFAYFSRSYAPCPPCIRVEKGTLMGSDFKTLARKMTLFFHNTSGLKGDDDALLGRLGGHGFPSVMLLDERGRVMARHRGKDRSAASFEKLLGVAESNRAELARLEKAVQAGTKGAAVDLFALEIQLRHHEPAVAYERLDALSGLDPARRKALHAAIVRQQVGAIQIMATHEHATQVAAGRRFAAMIEKDRIPAAKDAMFFWYFTAVYAEEERNVALLERAVAGLEPHASKLGGMREKWAKLASAWRKKPRR